ncbi:MAG: undecaprenyl-diphosphate phosphatase [Bacteriovoracales bacterium]|nr:undecaprenyl-diphosphate phosphatase [Bacteriovoracales bacterium]
MNPYDALIYGLVQGLSEFFPVSSSGHLVLLSKFLDLDDPGVAFDLLLHFGTGMAALIYFRKEIKDLMAAAFFFCQGKEHPALPWLKNFFFSTLVSVISILLIKNWAEQYGRWPPLVALNLMVFGLFMFLADTFSPENDTTDLQLKEHPRKAVLIGLAQSLAVFPGVSRSGITLTMGRLLGLKRREATRYSFLLSLPIIFAGTAKELFSLLAAQAQEDGGQAFSSFSAITGIIVSFVVGILSIHFFLKLMERRGLGFFAFYRLLLGSLILFFLWKGN